MTTWEMLLRLGAGVGLGTVIGLERQYRARMAGLRTNALVAAGGSGLVEVRAQLSAEHRDDKQLETAISRLSLEPSVTSVRWQAGPEAPPGALSGALGGTREDALDGKGER